MSKLVEHYDDDIAVFAKTYFSYLNEVLKAIDVDELRHVSDLLIEARNNRRMVFIIGNGGSASTASHMANDFAIGLKLKEKPLRAMSLCDNNSIITAVANDFGYEEIFTRQLAALAQKGDLLIAISASGNSPNLVHAIDWAKSNGVVSIALSSFVDGGKIRAMADYGIHVPTGMKEYGPAEDAHMILDHLFVSYLSQRLKAQMS